MPPYRIDWLEEAKADIRRLDRATAMRVFDGILHYARTGGGNVEPLHGDMTGSFRLRLGDYASCSLSKTTPCASSASATAAKRTTNAWAIAQTAKNAILVTVTAVTRYPPKRRNQSNALPAHPARGGLSLNSGPA